jgi:predicted nucleic acid-binding protein
VTRYYDTGLLLKLYTNEKDSAPVRSFVVQRAEALAFTVMHHTECVSALRLKCFRGECHEEEAAGALRDIESDLASGVLRVAAVAWDDAWVRCRILSDAHAAATGCRTLDALHVACALQLGAEELVTGDVRQAALGRKAGLRVVDPLKRERKR